MGYQTYFSGSFELDRPLEANHAAYLRKFADTRRMARPDSLKDAPDPAREAVGLPFGQQGAYYVGSDDYMGQDRDRSNVLDYNSPPSGQPGLWCQWMPNEEGTCLEWDQREKFYDYVEWIEYLIQHFLGPWGYVVNGTVGWEGEEQGDVGEIIVNDNVVNVREGRIIMGDEPHGDPIYRVMVRTTGSLQPSGTFWNNEVLYCGTDRDDARIAYHQSTPGDIYRGYGNSARETVMEMIEDEGSDTFSDDTAERVE